MLATPTRPLAGLKFDPRFVPLIRNGQKYSTIRRTPKAAPKDTVALESDGRLFGTATIASITEITIVTSNFRTSLVWLAGTYLIPQQKLVLIRSEGFENEPEFLQYLKDLGYFEQPEEEVFYQCDAFRNVFRFLRERT
jgi:hypothetical protein